MVKFRHGNPMPLVVSGMCACLLALLLAGTAGFAEPLASIRGAEEALPLLRASEDQQGRALALDGLAGHKLGQGLYEEALALSAEAVAVAGQAISSSLAGQLLYTRGVIELNMGNVTPALQNLRASADYLERTDDLAGLARSYSAIAECYRHFGEFESSMAWHRLAHATAIEAGDEDVLSAVFNSLGDLYDDLQQPEKALEYYQKSLGLEVGEPASRVVKHLNLGEQYHALERYADALASYELALSLNRQLELGQHAPEILVAMARTYLAMGEPRRALQWSQAALSSASDARVEALVIEALNTLSTVYVAQRDFPAAVVASEQALVLAQNQEVPGLIIATLRQLGSAYKSAGHYQKAMLTLELFNRANEKQLVDKAGRRLAQVQSGFEAQAAEQEIVRLQQENQIRDLQVEQQRQQRTVWILLVAFLAVSIAFLGWRYAAVRRTSRTDELTRIANRARMSQQLAQEFRRFRRYGNACCVMIVDIDNFKQFNDQHGHECGDRVLALVAQLLEGNVRDTDEVARWGGEEFVVLFPQTRLSEAQLVAERVRNAVDQHSFASLDAGSGSEQDLTVSITGGLAELSQENSDVQAWLQRADAALYQGKQEGKNRVNVAINIEFPEGKRDSVSYLHRASRAALR